MDAFDVAEFVKTATDIRIKTEKDWFSNRGVTIRDTQFDKSSTSYVGGDRPGFAIETPNGGTYWLTVRRIR